MFAEDWQYGLELRVWKLKVVIDLLYTVLMHSHLKPSHPALHKTLLAVSWQNERNSKKSNKNQDGVRIDLGEKIGIAKCE